MQQQQQQHHQGVHLVIFLVLLLPLATAESNDDLLDELNNTARILVRQIMLQQFYSQERVRSNGCSGLKQLRHQRDGSKPYHSETHIGSGVASIHDHGDSIRTMGMGEFHAVLNGVEFRTRHNDYLLKMPSRTSHEYDATENVPFPTVPQSVLNKSTVAEQITEMREYFRAFKQQNSSIRDYKPYFKPIISYMEGAWTITNATLDEPFQGERHWIDAYTWQELEDKVMFTSNAGTKHALENLGFLPRAVFGIANSSVPLIAQWNYRILAHPLTVDLPTNRLHVVDDLATRMVTGLSMADVGDTREARFRLNPTDSETWNDGRYVGTLLDKLMGEIPGKDNYGGSHTDEAFDKPALDTETDERLNTAYYHHLFKVDGKDGMGMQVRHRGYSDESLFMAMTDQEKIVSMELNNCVNQSLPLEDCQTSRQKWSYAIPLEIVYLNPLAEWNPYNIQYHGWSSEQAAEVVLADERDGSEELPFDGTNSIHFFRTPAEFYDDESEYMVRPADTTGKNVYVLDAEGTTRKVRASGHRIIIPSIENVGRIRQRYPIMPVHFEGTTTWKELQALKDIVLNAERYKHMFYTTPDLDADAESSRMNDKTTFYATVEMPPSFPKWDSHIHTIELTQEDYEMFQSGGVVTKTSSLDNSHQHKVSLLAQTRSNRLGYNLVIMSCDSFSHCMDGHGDHLLEGFTNRWEFVPDVYTTYASTGPLNTTKISSNGFICTANVGILFIAFAFMFI